MMKEYELMVIFGSNLKDIEVKEQISSLKNKIKELAGKVVKEDYWGIKRFAYEIKKQTEGYYLVQVISMDEGKISDLKNWLKLQEGKVLRHIVSKL